MPARSGGRILDVGCGTGVLLARLSASGDGTRLFGIDPVPEMLEVARRRLPAGVELREGSAEQLPYSDGAFDVVVSCSVFHYLADPLGALEEMKRVLAPGGTVVVTDWCADYLVCRICERYLSAFRRVRYSVYRASEWASLLARAGFADVDVDRYKISWIWGLMTATGRKRTTKGS